MLAVFEQLGRAIGNPIIFGVSASGVAIALMLSVLLIRAARRKRLRLEAARKGIASEPPDVDPIDAVDRHVPRSGPVREQWEEFKEGVVRIDGHPHNAIPMGDLLKDEAILQHVATWFVAQVHFPVIHQLPGVATGVGILGTFVGIAIGLSALGGGGGATIDDTQIADVINNLATAFSTSIIGVFAALLINLFGSNSESRLLDELSRLRDEIDRRVPRITAETALEAISGRRLGPLAEMAKTIAAKLAAIEQHAVDEVSYTRAIATHAEQEQERAATRAQKTDERTTALFATLKTVGATLDEIRRDSEESRVNLQTIASDLADTLSQSFDTSLQRHLAPKLAEIVDVVSKQSQDTKNSVDEQARRFTQEMLSEFAGSLQGSFDSMGAQVDSVSSRLENVSGSLQGVVSAAKSATEEQHRILQSGASALEQAHQRSAAAMNDLGSVQELGRALAAVATKLQETQTNTASLQQRQAKANHLAAQHAAEIGSSVAASAEAFKGAVASVEGVLPELHGAFERGASQLSAATAAVTSSVDQMQGVLTRTTASATTAAQQLQVLLGMLEKRIQSESTLLTGYRDAANSFASAFSAGKPTLEEIRGLAAELQSQRGQLGALAERLSALSASLTEIGGTASDKLGAVADRLEIAHVALAEGANSLAAVVHEHDEWGNQTSKTIQDFASGLSGAVKSSLHEYDSALTTAVSSLQASMKSLEDVADEIAEAADRRAKR